MDLQPTPVSPKSSNESSTVSEEQQSAVGNSSDHSQKQEAPAEPSKSSSPQQIGSSMQDTNGVNENTNGGKDEDEDMDNASEISDFSELSGESWHPVAGPFAWVQEQMRQGQNARSILEDLVPPGTSIPADMDPMMLWKLILNIVSDPPQRKKLENINTLEDVVHLLKTCKNIIVLTGAGVSVSCGIPDFRSRDGVYARLAVDFPDLPDPQAMFDIHYFRSDPRPFFKFAKEIYPGQFKPSLCHHFIRLIESQGKLLRNYTQNIDTLEQEAGIEKVIQCHGSFATASCTNCGLKVKSDEVRKDIFKQVIPKCPQCPPTVENAIMKPDIVFFGESLPEDFHQQIAADKDTCDLLIVIGSSLKVRPVALIPNSVLPDVPQILINRERLHYLNFDIELLGNCDDIVAELCRRLGDGWDQLATPGPSLTEVALSSLPTPPVSPPLDQTSSSSSSLPTANQTTSSSSSEAKTAEKSTPSASSSLVEDKKKQEQENTSGGGGVDVDSTQNNAKTETNQSVVSEKKEEGGVVVSVSSSDVSSVLPSSGDQCGKEEALLPDARNKTEQVSTSTDKCCGDREEGGETKKDPPTTSDVVSSTSTSSGVKKHSGCGHHHHHNHHDHHQHHHHHSHHNHHHHQHSHHNHHQDHHHQKHHHHHHHKHHDDDCSEAEPIHKKPRLESDKDAAGATTATTTGGTGGGETADLSSSSAVEQMGGEEDIMMDNEMEEMLLARKNRVSLALRLADDQFLFLPPSRYVFKGAEVFSDEDDDEDDDSDNNEEEEEDDGEDEMGDADNGDDNEEKKEENEKATGKEGENEKENNDNTDDKSPQQECGSSKSKDTPASSSSSSDGPPPTSTDAVAVSSSSTAASIIGNTTTTTTTATTVSSSSVLPVDSSLQ